MNGPIWHQAAAVAARAHKGQYRKDGITPYIAHPMRVAITCAVVFGFQDERILAAALLHDVIEDANVDFDEIEDEVSREVAEIVAALSKDTRLPEDEREPAYDAQLAAGPWQARLIKLADAFDNFNDSQSDARRATMRQRALRAIKLAEGDERLAGARRIVAELIEKVNV